MRKILLFILIVLLIILIFYKSPVSALLNYNKARALFDAARYEQSLSFFERSLFADPKAPLARYFYVMALSKSDPKYSVQKKLLNMANSQIEDEAKKTAVTQSKVLKHKLLKGLENNYIYNAVYGEGILRWDIRSFPLKVYIDDIDTVPEYYIESIREAFDVWVKSTNFVKFTYVDSKSAANIIISFSDINKNDCNEGGCKYVVAYTEPIIKGHNLLSHMNLTFYRTNPRNEGFSKSEIFNTAVHEIGHTLGVMGHSDNPADVMFAQKDDGTLYEEIKGNLSISDVQTLVLLYRLEPSVSNVENLKSESFYYLPLILGSNDTILQKKLEELKDYIKNYPEMAAGYINISAVYADLGDFDKALNSLENAEIYAFTQDEKYLVAYNRAITYYNLQDYNKAFEFANIAKSIKDTDGVRELITEIENLKS